MFKRKAKYKIVRSLGNQGDLLLKLYERARFFDWDFIAGEYLNERSLDQTVAELINVIIKREQNKSWVDEPIYLNSHGEVL